MIFTREHCKQMYDLSLTKTQKEIAEQFNTSVSTVCKAIDRHVSELIERHRDAYKPKPERP